jgi:hypothetical protein
VEKEQLFPAPFAGSDWNECRSWAISGWWSANPLEFKRLAEQLKAENRTIWACQVVLEHRR